MAGNTVGEFESERMEALRGVLAGTVILHQWGFRVSTTRDRVVHRFSVPVDAPDIDMQAHEEAAREVATLLEGVNPLMVTYLGQMTSVAAAIELSSTRATATA